MTTRVLLTLAALLTIASTAAAQTHPCDVTPPTTATITQNTPHKVQFCSLESDKVEATIAYVDGVASALQPVTAVGAKSATSNKVLYETALFLSISNRGQHTLQVSAYNRDAAGVAQEGPKSSPFVFAVDAEFPLTLSLTADKASPQLTTTGSITLTALAQGGIAPYQFKWLIGKDGGAPGVWANWGSNVKVWTPSVGGPGTYQIVVWARSADSTADAPEAQTTLTYVITAPVVPPPGAPVIVGVVR